MPSCVRVSGDFFRDLSKIQVPGVDAIWNQIWPETINDFPKFASSVAHVYGKRRAFSESFAAYNIPPTIPTAKYAVDYQMVRGINFFEFMFWMAGSKNTNWMTDPGMKALNDYTGRVTYMLGLGKPGARIAVYYPTSTLWLGNNSYNQDLVNISQLLLTHQRDFDWVSDDAFSEALTVHSTCLENRSGQKYYTLIIPSAEAVSEAAWEKIGEFAKRGGKVLFWGRRPSMLYGKSFFENKPFPLSGKNMFEEAAIAWTPTVVAAMPQPELFLESAAPKVSYTRRHLEGGEIYFVTNEGEEPYEFTAVFDGSGTVREWNGYDGSSKVLDGGKDGPRTRIRMTLNPWESKLISIERQNTEYNVRKYGVKGNGKSETQAIQAVIDRAYASGGGTVVFPAGNYLSGALFFPSGVNLRVEKKAVLKGSADPSEYPMVPTRFEGTDKKWRCAFLNFDCSPGVSVSGEGTIDGNGLEWNKLPYDGGRPRLICLTACDGGRISGLRLRNQACWCLHLLYTQGFDIEGLNIEAKEYIPSSDGIDIDSSSDVRIADCYVSVHDDCISIKSGKDEEGRRVGRPSEDILIENCHFGYGHGAITMGSEISGDIRNVTARNCRVDEGNWAPIRFKSQPSRGGTVENITFENIEVSHVRNIFDVNLEWRPGSDRNRVIEYSDPVTQLRNITVRNVHGDGRTMGHIHGFASDPINKDVFHFENCSFHTETGLSLRNAAVDMNGLKYSVDKGEGMRSGPAAQAAEIIERVFNYLDSCTPYQLVDAEGKEVKASDLDAGTSFKRGSFGINTYEWGVTYSGLMLAAEVLSEDKYLDYVYDRLNALGQAYDSVRKVYAKNPKCRLALMEAPRFLDDCGSMCAAMSKATLKDPVRAKDFRNVLERWYRFCMFEEYRLGDGILARHRPAENSIWLDDMYMGITPIAFRGALAAAENDAAAEEKCFQEAIRQVRLFGKYLWIPEKNLYRHGWIEGMSEHPDYHWARCNGWAMLTMCDVLDAVPEGTPGREEVLEQLKKHIKGVAEWQASDGRWHQLLNKDESYLETSATAIFVYCIAHAVNEGWIDKTSYRDVARSGWSGLVSQINEQGQVENTCVGTGLGWTNTFYANRPVSVMAAHGYGPVLLAAAEIIKLQNSLTK